MKKMSEANEKEFEELAAFVNFYATHVWKVPPEASVHPSHFLQPISGTVTKSQLLTGLRQAANDTVEDSAHWTPGQLEAMDAACRARKLPTLSEMRRRFSRQFRAVLKRQCIISETEYYLIAGITKDLGSDLTDDERTRLDALVTAYEEKAAQT